MILRVRRNFFEITMFPNSGIRASSKNHSYLRIKTTTIFRQVCCFNLQQGPGVVKLDSTKVGETVTRKPPMCKARRENRSRVSVRVMSVRAASSSNTAEPKYDMLVSSMTYISHNSLVFYSFI